MLTKTLVALQLGCSRKIELIKKRINTSLKDETGASTVEYALLIAVIVIGVVTAASFMVPQLKDIFLKIVEAVKKLAGV